MSEVYYVEGHDLGANGPVWSESFKDFETAFAVATLKAIQHPGQRIRLHVPSQASDEERRRVAGAGWDPI